VASSLGNGKCRSSSKPIISRTSPPSAGNSIGFNGDRRARQGERDRADGQATLLDLRAERLDGILPAHDEDLDAPPLHCGSNEAIAEQKNSKVSPSKHHKIRLR